MRTLLHLSDVHFGPRFLPEVGEGVLRLVSKERPDLVVISGDLTQRAKRRQFQQARSFVDRIEELGIACMAVPGNHDVPMYRWLFMERFLSPYGAYRRAFSADLEPVYRDDEMVLVGLNTAHGLTLRDGRLTRAQLQRTRRILAAAPPEAVRIVVAHHHLIPPPRFDTPRLTRGAEEAARLFSSCGVELVLSGHLHQSFVGHTEAYYPAGQRSVLLVHAGTATSSRGRGCEKQRNTCNWLQLDSDAVTISPLEWHGQSATFRELSRHRYPRQASTPRAFSTDRA